MEGPKVDLCNMRASRQLLAALSLPEVQAGEPMKKKRRAARRSRSAPSESPSRASRLGGGRSGRMTAKERVLAHDAEATATKIHWMYKRPYAIHAGSDGLIRRLLSDWHSTEAAAWADAAARLP